MKKKKFIKEMRAAGFPRHIINQACDAVKECGGRLSYTTFTYRFNILNMFTNISYPTAIKAIKQYYNNGAGRTGATE